MRRKKPETVRAELLPPSPTLTEADFKRMVAQAIEQKVSEAMSHGSEADFQPWFQPREVSYEIRRRQTVTEQNKWTYFFEDWGCIVCGTKEKAHYTLGFCKTCYNRVKQRLIISMRRHAPAKGQADLSFMDTVRIAREALSPSMDALARNVKRSGERK